MRIATIVCFKISSIFSSPRATICSATLIK